MNIGRAEIPFAACLTAFNRRVAFFHHRLPLTHTCPVLGFHPRHSNTTKRPQGRRHSVQSTFHSPPLSSSKTSSPPRHILQHIRLSPRAQPLPPHPSLQPPQHLLRACPLPNLHDHPVLDRQRALEAAQGSLQLALFVAEQLERQAERFLGLLLGGGRGGRGGDAEDVADAVGEEAVGGGAEGGCCRF